MKHWGELNELETEIIRVSEFKNLFKLLVAGTENYVDLKVMQSAIYTMEGMIDDIDSTLYEKFQTVFDAVRDESSSEEKEEFLTTEDEFNFKFRTMNDYATNNPQTEYQGSTVQNNSNSYEDEAFKDLEKALKNWKNTAP